MQLRKVQEMGGVTLLVSLPRDWAKSYAIKKGSLLSIEGSGDGGLLIYPSRSGEEDVENEISIDYPSKYGKESLPNEITAAYLMGYDLIRIKGAHRIVEGDREVIISSIKRLIGLEIVEEDAQGITSQFLVDKTAVEPSKIFRRISTLVRAMISDTLKQLYTGESIKFESIGHRDDEVDRLHFLLVRLIRTAVREPRTASKFGLNTIDCLDYRVAASALETAGDYAVELSNSIARIGSLDQRIQKALAFISETLESIEDSASRSFINRDFTLALKAFDDYQKLESALAELREEEGRSSPDILHSLDIIERIVRCHRDVADLISPPMKAA